MSVVEPLNIISLGAGVQSSTMALMAAHGEIKPMPGCAIFADTQWEPKSVYEWLDWLEKQLPFPVYRVSIGNIRDDIINNKTTTGQRFTSVPFFMDGGMGGRQCTSEYKILPVNRKMRELLGYEPRQRIPGNSIYKWIGISMDEAPRMKPSRNKWCVHTWPLVDLGMARQDCLNWMKDKGYPEPSKSSCIGCPYHNDLMWREMKLNDPDSFNDAVYVDKKIRDGGTYGGMDKEQYMHRSLLPLDQVDFRNAKDFGQIDAFGEECDGMCGV